MYKMLYIRFFVFFLACLTFISLTSCQTVLDEDPIVKDPPVEEPQTPIVNDPVELLNIESNFPIIYLDTKDLAIDSHDEYTPVNITMRDENESYSFDQLSGGIRLRGHSTANFDKKPYRIRFDEEIQPLGLGSGPSRVWVLLAEYVDISMFRNYATFKIANELLRTSFSASAAFVEVVLNNVHQGVYLLTEQTQVGEYRVAIDESGEDDGSILDTGYLLELETDPDRRNLEGLHMESWIHVPGYSRLDVDINWSNIDQYYFSPLSGFYVIKSDALSTSQIQYIQDYLVSIYDAIYLDRSQETIESLIDISSAVDMYLLELITDNLDYNFSSNFIYKDQAGKLVFGPPWDHDLAYGNHYQSLSTEEIHLFHLLYELSQMTWFQDMVKTRFEEINQLDQSFLMSVMSDIQVMSELYSMEFQRDYALWNQTRRDDGWHVIYSKYDSQEEALDDFTSWFTARIQFLEDYFALWN